MVSLIGGLIACVISHIATTEVAEPVKAIVWTATWCPACKEYKPIIEELEKDGWDIVSYNVDEYPEEAADWGVKGGPIPQTIIYTSQKKLDVFIGARQKGPVLKWFAKFKVFRKKAEEKNGNVP